jgi:3D (Asp-Asp-Asp) domain-containing protein
MRIRFAASARQFVERTLNQLTMRVRRLWLTVALSFGAALHWLIVAPRSIATRLTARQVMISVVLAAMVVTPSVLFMAERNHRMAEERAYQSLDLASAAETTFLRSSLSELLAERTRLTDVLLDAGYTIRSNGDVTVKVVATGYSSSIYETDSTPFTTASNTRTRNGILALSRDLLRRYTPGAPFGFGDRVHVTGLGEFVVEDSMNQRWNNRIDIWFPSRLQALRFGVREVYLQTVDEDLTVPDELSETEPAASITGM